MKTPQPSLQVLHLVRQAVNMYSMKPAWKSRGRGEDKRRTQVKRKKDELEHTSGYDSGK